MTSEVPHAASGQPAHILVVDDNPINRKTLTRAMENAGHRVTTAENGSQALAVLQSSLAGSEDPTFSPAPIDVILLDVLMPEMDGYQVLQIVKADSRWQHIPVIMISAVDEMDSVVHCIELGATDYLHKPFKAALLHARLNSSLAAKRLRDLELEYLEQVGRIVQAAEAVEAAAYNPASLDDVARRPDALGRLAHTFQRMAQEVHLREQRLLQQLHQMQLDVDEIKKALSEPASIYLPFDRIHALVTGAPLAEETWGTVLSADISGFTPLTEALTRQLGLQRGAEELTRTLNQVYKALTDTVHSYHGSVISFSGDALTCWFDHDCGLEALSCGLALQKAMQDFNTITTPSGAVFSLGIKVATAAGPIHRYLVGDPGIQLIEVLAGRTLDNLADTEKHAQRGEVVAHAALIENLSKEHRLDCSAHPDAPMVYTIHSISNPAPGRPWPEIAPDALSDEQCRPWLLPEVYDRLQMAGKQHLAEFRPVAALFLQFTGLDYDHDPQAGQKLQAFIARTQSILRGHHGSLIQLTTGDKGSYLYAVFGAPTAHMDSPLHAVRAAFDLHRLPRQFPYITRVNIGITLGQMRVGAYGGDSRRTYGALGEQANLAARLMQHANNSILCSETITQATRDIVAYKALGSIQVKGREAPLSVYRPVGEKHHLTRRSTTLVGRQTELDYFTSRLQALSRGSGGVLWIHAEPGSGKTRLLKDFERQALLVEGLHIYRLTGSLEFSFSDIEQPALILVDNADTLPLRDLEGIISLPRKLPPTSSTPAGSLAPILVILAGLLPGHLLDIPRAGSPQSLEADPVNLVRLDLPPLNLDSAHHLAKDMLGTETLPDPVAHLVAFSGGLPFYIEKILEHLLASGQLQVRDGICTVQSGSALEKLFFTDQQDGFPGSLFETGHYHFIPANLISVLPPTIQGLLKSRIESLSAEAQMGLRLASALGQAFPRAAFTDLLPIVEENSLAEINPETVLAGLIDQGLLKQLPAETDQGVPSCAFTIGLLASSAYETMLFAHRRGLHRQIAGWYENTYLNNPFPDHLLLAEHWRRAEEMGKAIDHFEKGALQAHQAGDLKTAGRLMKATLDLSAAAAVLSRDFRPQNAQD